MFTQTNTRARTHAAQQLHTLTHAHEIGFRSAQKQVHAICFGRAKVHQSAFALNALRPPMQRFFVRHDNCNSYVCVYVQRGI